MLTQFKQFIADVREARIPSWLFWLIMISASIGFLDAGYLSIQHAMSGLGGGGVNCVVGASGSCNIVLDSIYARVAGIPLAYIGLLYYTTILVLIVHMRFKRNVHVWWVLRGIIVRGFIASVYFVYLQLVVLRTICPYCMLSALASATMFAGVVSHHMKKQLK